MTRTEILVEVGKVLQDRHEQHGDASVVFDRIADLWSAYLGVDISVTDVGVLMMMLKLSRIQVGMGTGDNGDSLIDLVGYATLIAEMASTQQLEA